MNKKGKRLLMPRALQLFLDVFFCLLGFRWDAGVSMVCVLVAILTPYRMAFAHVHAMGWLAFDAMVDVLFVIGETN